MWCVCVIIGGCGVLVCYVCIGGYGMWYACVASYVLSLCSFCVGACGVLVACCIGGCGVLV